MGKNVKHSGKQTKKLTKVKKDGNHKKPQILEIHKAHKINHRRSGSKGKKIKSEKTQNSAITTTSNNQKRKTEKGLSLRERMLNRLQGARFRYLNEQMYTGVSNETEELFHDDPRAFQAYHEGFQQQVQHWQFNPLDVIIANLKKKKANLVIADFGCGEARLAQTVDNMVYSFDLVALNHHVTACDMAHTPLEDASIDIAVFSLSLMGSNIGDYFCEANRVLKIGGQLKIAEVASRFENINSFVYKVRKFGFQLTSNNNTSNSYFIFLNFKKISNTELLKTLPTIKLKSCIYKKR